MTGSDQELDQWIEGLRGRGPPSSGTGFDTVDARAVQSLRRQQSRDERAVPDELLARGRQRLDRHLATTRAPERGAVRRPSPLRRFLSPWPFAAGAAAGLTAALIGMAVLPELLHAPAEPGQQRPPVAAPRLTVAVPSEDPSADQADLVATLLGSGIAFSVAPPDTLAYSEPLPLDQREVILVYPERSSPALEAWFRRRGITPPPAGAEVLILINRAAAADRP